MGKVNPPLKKTCKHCGLQKPLRAFLQLSDKNRDAYGNICTTCRKTTLAIPNISEESTTSTTDHRIGTKERMAAEIEKKERLKQTDEIYYTERKEEEKKQLNRTKKSENTLKNEKKHHKTYLNKRSFIKTTQKTEHSNPSVFGGVEQITKEGEFNLDVPVIDTAIPKVKHQGILFQQFKARLGESAPIVTAAERLIASQKHQQKNGSLSSSDYIEKTWPPPSKRSGK